MAAQVSVIHPGTNNRDPSGCSMTKWARPAHMMQRDTGICFPWKGKPVVKSMMLVGKVLHFEKSPASMSVVGTKPVLSTGSERVLVP